MPVASCVQDNRETGENPVRSRRCKEGVVSNEVHYILIMGRTEAMLKSEPEDLPFSSVYMYYGR